MSQAKPKAQSENQNEAEPKLEVPFCGIVMPISAIGNHDASHWNRVRQLIDEAVTDAGYRPRLVSESEDTSVIHANIVQNLYDDPIVICDVSGKNPNVMFELGLRLAFDKPTIIIKDNETEYSFDTSPIKHIGYRADLRYDDSRLFKDKLTQAIVATIARKERETDYSPFLGHFQRIKVADLGTKEVQSGDYIISLIDAVRRDVALLSQKITISSWTDDEKERERIVIQNVLDSFKKMANFDPAKVTDRDALRRIVLHEIKKAGVRTDHQLIADLTINILAEEAQKSGNIFD